jgi:hypothetical protein
MYHSNTADNDRLNRSRRPSPTEWKIDRVGSVNRVVIWLKMAELKPSRMMWWEPRWSFVPRELHDFQKSLPLRSWLRIIIVSAAIVVPIALIANALMPGLQFNWLGAFAISVASIVGILLVFPILMVSIPPLVFITENGFGWWWPPLLHDGFSYFKRIDLQSVTITVRDDGQHYLRFRTSRLCKRIGIARRVNLDNLLELFGDCLVVRDRRQRGSTEPASHGSVQMETSAK